MVTWALSRKAQRKTMSVKLKHRRLKPWINNNNDNNLKGTFDVRPALFIQAFNDLNEKERNDFAKWQFLRHMLADFESDKKFLASLLSILDPLQRKDAVYYEVKTFREETLYGPRMERPSYYMFDDSENEQFLKEWYQHFDGEAKQALILKVLQKINSRHLLCLTKMIRWRLFELEELAGDAVVEKDDHVKAKHGQKKLRASQQQVSLGQFLTLGLPQPTKYFANFVVFLPLTITKRIFKYLDHASILNCLKVSKGWKYLAQEVIDEKWTSVRNGSNGPVNGSSDDGERKEESCLHRPYNMTLVTSTADSKRVVDFREDVVSFTTSERNSVTLVRKPFEYEAERNVGGGESGGGIGRSLKLSHVGSIKCILTFCSKGILISSSYDATIRKWSLKTGKCLKIYTGHGDAVCCLGSHGDILLSGSRDKSCRVWSIETGKCHQTFVHDSTLTGVSVHNVDFCVTSTTSGTLRIYNISSGILIKKFQSHDSVITCLKTSRRYVATSSADCSVKVWTFNTDDKQTKKSLVASLEHPKAVQCIDLKNKELVAGCDDGKIRIWSLPGGVCSRILWGNRYGEPILHLIVASDRLLINTNSSVILYEFSSDNKTPPKSHDPIFKEEPKSRLRSALHEQKGKSKSKKASSAPLPLPLPSSSSSPALLPGPHQHKKASSSAPVVRTATLHNQL